MEDELKALENGKRLQLEAGEQGQKAKRRRQASHKGNCERYQNEDTTSEDNTNEDKPGEDHYDHNENKSRVDSLSENSESEEYDDRSNDVSRTEKLISERQDDKDKEVIEILDSDSSISSSSSIASVDASNDANNTLDDNEVENISQLPSEPVNNTSEEQEWSNDDLESDVDEDDVRGEIRKEQIVGITKSNIFMAVQGFRQKSIENLHSANTDNTTGSSMQGNTINTEAMPFDEDEVEFECKLFKKNHCYQMETEQGRKQEIVGILDFLSNSVARCILIVRFEDTILGIEDEGLE